MVTVEEYQARQREIKARLQELDELYRGQALPDDDKRDWNSLNEEYQANDKTIAELLARRQRIEELSGEGKNRESGADFQVQRSDSVRGNDIYDLTTVRSSVSSPYEAAREMRDRALRSVESAVYPHGRAQKEDVDGHLDRLLQADRQQGRIAHHMLVTGSPTYQRAFEKYVKGQGMGQDEQRAASLASAGGGFAVPYTLDPTIIPTSNLSVNPYRAVARVEQIPGDDWKGVSSAGVTAAFAAEAVEATDNTPTLAQPAVSTEKAVVFIPYSIDTAVQMDSGSAF